MNHGNNFNNEVKITSTSGISHIVCFEQKLTSTVRKLTHKLTYCTVQFCAYNTSAQSFNAFLNSKEW